TTGGCRASRPYQGFVRFRARGQPAHRTGSTRHMPAATPPASDRVYQLKVSLRGISPLVWRRLLVRADTSIAQLHDILQIAMGWEDEHLHRFPLHGRDYGVAREGGLCFSDNPHQVRLADFRLRQGERFVYEYDLHDFWQHDVRLEQVLA